MDKCFSSTPERFLVGTEQPEGQKDQAQLAQRLFSCEILLFFLGMVGIGLPDSVLLSSRCWVAVAHPRTATATGITKKHLCWLFSFVGFGLLGLWRHL